jgi:Fe-S oxidoreductase
MQIQDSTITTDNCRYCLMCRHMCPVGHVTNMETLTPHGWGLTIASVRRGLLEWNDGSVAVLYKCADCGTCRAHCVNDQPLPEAIAATRDEVTQRKLALPVVYEIDQKLDQWENPFKNEAPETTQDQGETALFVGDEARYLRPSVLEGALKLLDAVGIQPVLIGVGRNNGYLASSLGLRRTAETLARSNLTELKATGATRLLVLTPGDFFTFNQLYSERLGIEWPQDVELVELVPLLAGQLEAGSLKLKPFDGSKPCAYVDPTHSVRVDTRYDAPRNLLSAILSDPCIELFWRRERAHPCGNGALQFTNPDISEQLTRARLEDAAQSGAQLVVTEDPGCLSHLSRYSADFGLEVRGLYELLADYLD